MVLEDDPKMTRFVSKCSTENILNKLKESNVVSEPDYSLDSIVDIIACNDELKDGKHLNLENSGFKINNYILERLCPGDEF